MSSERYVPGLAVLSQVMTDLRSGEPPRRFKPCSGELGRFCFTPGLVTLIAGAPAMGKTAFICQMVVDALRLNPTLHCVLANVEMSPDVLIARQIARISGVSLTAIQERQLTDEHHQRVDIAFDALSEAMSRLHFVKPPFSLDNVDKAAAEALGDCDDVLLVFDYLQRFSCGDASDKRTEIDGTMNALRQFASAGAAVLAVSSLSRSRDSKGRSSYSGDLLSMASMRGSGEIEFGGDDVWILCEGLSRERRRLKHEKCRNGETRDIELIFDGSLQRFSAVADEQFAAVAEDEQPASEPLFEEWTP